MNEAIANIQGVHANKLLQLTYFEVVDQWFRWTNFLYFFEEFNSVYNKITTTTLLFETEQLHFCYIDI